MRLTLKTINSTIMFEKIKGNLLFHRLFKRPDINEAYKMVPETDSWYDTISTVHRSLGEIQKLPHEVLEIKSHDGLKLKGIYYPNQSDKTMIYVHGYTSHAERESAFPGLFYLSQGFNVLILYLRAHALSEGRYISFGALEPFDVMGWVDKVNQMTPDGKILIHGLSMGGGIVLNLSNKEMKGVKCLVSDAPSTSVEPIFDNVAKDMFKKNSDKIAFYGKERFKKEFDCNLDACDSLKIVADSKYPILLSAGSNEHMEEIFDEIKKTNPKDTEIVILPGCNHGNGMYKQTALYQGKIKEFAEKYI